MEIGDGSVAEVLMRGHLDARRRLRRGTPDPVELPLELHDPHWGTSVAGVASASFIRSETTFASVAIWAVTSRTNVTEVAGIAYMGFRWSSRKVTHPSLVRMSCTP